MATKQGQVTKIYELRTLGFKDIHTQLQQISKDYEAIKRAKRDAESQVSKSQDADQLRRYREEVQKTKLEEAELRKQRQQMINDAKAEQLARQAAINQQRLVIANNNAEAGSIAAIRRERSELNALVIQRNPQGGGTIDFRGQILTYDQAIAKLKELTSAEQAFRRQFQQDGTLVGEYTTGIIQAFKRMGLDDLIGGQVTKAQARIQELNGSFDRLQQELVETRVNGQGNLEVIERQMIENRKETIALQTEVGRLQTELRGAGDVGNQITTSIANGFKNAKAQIGQLLIGYFGFQAAFSGIQRTFTNTMRVDSLDSAMTVVSKTEEELAVNQQFLAQTTERLGLELLSTTQGFKLFYAAATQAGISAEDTRMIFEAASSASANLKLSQEDTNAVMLAFGQIASKGKVQAEELRGQIGERIPGAFSMAARAMGVTEMQLNKMMETGQVMAKDFLPLFAKELQATFGVDAQKHVTGLQATVNRFKNEFANIISENRKGLANFFTLILSIGGGLVTLLGLLMSIPFPLLIAGITAVTASLALYRAEQIRSYIVTQLATKEGLIYNAYLLLQAIRTKAVALITKVATYEIVLFNGALRISPLGWFLTLIGLIIPAVALFAKSVRVAKGEMSVLNDINKEANRTMASQIGVINSWMAVIKSSATAADTKRKAVEELIKKDKEFSNVIKDNVIDLNELERAYKKVIEQITLKARAEASAKLTAEKEQKVNELATTRQRIETEFATGSGSFRKITGLTDTEVNILKGGDFLLGTTLRANGDGASFLESDYSKIIALLSKREEAARNEYLKYLSAKERADAELKGFIDNGTQQGTQRFEVDIAALRKQIEALDTEINAFQGAKKDLDAKVKQREALQKQLDDLLNKTRSPRDRASTLTAGQKDDFKEIDARRDEALAVEQARRVKNEIDEETYLRNILAINQKAIDEKLQLLKGKNAEELKQAAQLRLDRITLEQDTNNKIFELRKKAITDQFEGEKIAAGDAAQAVEDDPNSSETARAQAKLDADKRILAAQVLFNQQMDALEKQFNVLSKKNAQDRARDQRQAQAAVNSGQRELFLARIEDIKKAGETLQAEFELIIDRAKLAVIADKTLTQSQKEARLRTLENQRQYGVLVRQGALYKQLEAEFKAAYDKGLITLAQYEEIVRKLEELQGRIANANPTTNPDGSDPRKANSLAEVVQGGAMGRGGLRKALGVEEDSEEDEALGRAIAESFSLARDVMNSYFDAERERIQENLQLQLDRLDMEKQQVIARAQSQAEIESIERQYEAKKKKEQQKAGEEMKKSKRSEAKIALAAELANIWASVWQLGPIAGPIAGGVFTALALARFALRIGEINREKFEYGGMPARGGRIGGRPHSSGGTPFTFGGQPYEAEVDELAVIRTKDAPRNQVFSVVGTQSQIASAANSIGGGTAFAPGARIKKFDYGGSLGATLSAPVFSPAVSNTYISGAGSEEVLSAVVEQARAIQQVSQRIDRLQVTVNAKDVTNTQNKIAKQSSIGTL